MGFKFLRSSVQEHWFRVMTIYERVWKSIFIFTLILSDLPDVSTQAENPVALAHSSQTVTAWSKEPFMALERDGANCTYTISAMNGLENGAELHL